VKPDERVVLGDISGPGTIRHIWMTFLPAPPEVMRAVWMELFYDDSDEPSAAVPCLDFFGLPMGRPVAYSSALASAHEGRGFNSFVPIPFESRVRVELVNSSPQPLNLYFQIDYTLEPARAQEPSYLHVSFRRENPTTLRRDFVSAEGLEGPGRFLGCNVGIRVIDPGSWYGEGEVKIYRDGDRDLPTICGTGLEDYVGTAWGLGAHASLYAGAPLSVSAPDAPPNRPVDWVGFYRWHLLDPVMFASELRVTIQQIGAAFFPRGFEEQLAEYERTNPPAGAGWIREPSPHLLAWGIAERVDDYCATAFVYCRRPQPVPRLDVDAALADIERRPYESIHSMEAAAAVLVAPPQ
jgi:hypothetical protein